MRTKTQRKALVARQLGYGWFRAPIAEGGGWQACPDCKEKVYGWPFAWDNEREIVKKIKEQMVHHLEDHDHDNGGLD